jgi:hypothetical protein
VTPEQRIGTRDRFMSVASLLRSAGNLTQGIVEYAALDGDDGDYQMLSKERVELRQIVNDIDRVCGRLRRAGRAYVPGWPS